MQGPSKSYPRITANSGTRRCLMQLPLRYRLQARKCRADKQLNFTDMNSTKLENKLQAIYKAAEYDIACDNRSYFTKSLNKALSNSNVNFLLVKNGYVRTNSNGFDYNLRIFINGKGKCFMLKSVDPESLCDCFARVAKMPHVKESITIHQGAYICSKCNGKGIIPAFMHVCSGICFDCLGIGYRFNSGKW